MILDSSDSPVKIEYLSRDTSMLQPLAPYAVANPVNRS